MLSINLYTCIRNRKYIGKWFDIFRRTQEHYLKMFRIGFHHIIIEPHYCIFSFSFSQFITILCSQPRWLSGLRRSRVHSLWLLVDHCVLRNWDRILVRAVKGLISRAGMVSICPLLWQRDVKLQQTTNITILCIVGIITQKIDDTNKSKIDKYIGPIPSTLEKVFV